MCWDVLSLKNRIKHRYEIVIGEKGLAVVKTGCLASHQGVGLIACLVMADYLEQKQAPGIA